MATSDKVGIFGPSHILRILFNIENNILPGFKNVDYIGAGGMPIWHSLVNNNIDKYERIIVVLGDFRFGNRVFSEDIDNSRIFGIEKSLINAESDTKLYQKSIEQLSKFIIDGKELLIIPWDLTFRELENKTKGKYVSSEGVYKHPIWNISDFAAHFPEQVVDISDVDAAAIIDKSNHPSMLGYALLYYLINMHLKRDDSYKNNIGEFYRRSKRILSRKINAIQLKNVAIVADARSYRLLNSMLSNGSLPKHKGLDLLRYEVGISYSYERILYLSDNVFESAEDISKLLENHYLLTDTNRQCCVLLNRYNFMNLVGHDKKNKYHFHNKNTYLEAKYLERTFDFVLNVNTNKVYTRAFYELRPSKLSFKGFVYILYLLSDDFKDSELC